MIRPVTTTLVRRFLAGLALSAVVGYVTNTAAAQETLSPTSSGLTAKSLSRGVTLDQEDATQSTVIVAPSELPSSSTTVSGSGGKIHIFPTVSEASNLAKSAPDNGPLLYHAGGSIMGPSVTIYPVFWIPSKLQNGKPTSITNHYAAVQVTMLAFYAGHSLGNINTQYFQTLATKTHFIQNKGGLDANNTYFVDSSPYPASGCTDTVTPGNCLTDAQIRTEIQKVLNFAHLTGGLDKIFMLFTGPGEGSCFDSTSKSCAYTRYCAYHSSFLNGTTPVIYSNEPYGDLAHCQAAGIPSPNNDAVADAAASTASHELSESITDPLGNAWFTSRGNENGDLCAYTYGNASWANGNANQMWSGYFFELQQEYSNHTFQCLNVGP